METTIRVMLVEDHPEYRETVEFALSREPDIELAGAFGTSERALRDLKESGGRNVPDVILLDLNLPGLGGHESIPLFAAEVPGVKILVLTQSDHEEDVLKSISLGAAGYLLKSSTVSQIAEGIRLVMTGGASLDPSVAKFILTTLQKSLPNSEVEELLTEREMEVLTLLAEGLVKKEIAMQLGIGTTTVVTHVAHIYGKLNVQNAPAAVAKAFKMGILPSGSEK